MQSISLYKDISLGRPPSMLPQGPPERTCSLSLCQYFAYVGGLGTRKNSVLVFFPCSFIFFFAFLFLFALFFLFFFSSSLSYYQWVRGPAYLSLPNRGGPSRVWPSF